MGNLGVLRRRRFRPRVIIPCARVDLEVFSTLRCHDADGSVRAVRFEVGGFIGDKISAANLVTQLVERLAAAGFVPVIEQSHFRVTALTECICSLRFHEYAQE